MIAGNVSVPPYASTYLHTYQYPARCTEGARPVPWDAGSEQFHRTWQRDRGPIQVCDIQRFIRAHRAVQVPRKPTGATTHRMQPPGPIASHAGHVHHPWGIANAADRPKYLFHSLAGLRGDAGVRSTDARSSEYINSLATGDTPRTELGRPEPALQASETDDNPAAVMPFVFWLAGPPHADDMT